jgi:amino acid adenylation domain-containing protein
MGGLVDLLSRIWERELGVVDIDPGENFLDLGGDSMTATAVVAQIRARLGVDPPLRLVFDHPTVRELADALTDAYGDQLDLASAPAANDPVANDPAASGPAEPARPTLWGGPALPGRLLDTLAGVVVQRPHELAVIEDGRRLTYADLFGWAGAIAESLTWHGVRPGDRVAVACHRGAGAVATLVATVLLGAAYVPLDRSYPARRLEHMVADSDPAVLVHDGEPPAFAARCARLALPDPADAPPFTPADAANWRAARNGPELPVYVIYTSGSTGWPKGVAVDGGCVDAMVAWQVDYSPEPDLRTAQFAPLNFDVFFQETLATLAGGGTLAIVPERLRREPGHLLAWLAEHRVQRLFLPYVALQMLAVAATPALLAELRLVEVNAAGEQLVCTGAIRELFARLPGCRLVNHYGQSESAMVSAHVLTGPPDQWPALPPIGVPLPGCEVLVDVLDPAEPAVGELLVTGRPLAAGYLNQPELTSARWTPIARTPRGNERAFRTRDLVELIGGQLHYLSRLDSDVKIRGVRVNLQEIDARLLACPGVAAAATVVVHTASGARSLRAAIVPLRPHDPPGAEELIAELRRTLPDVAVPVSITTVPELPRTPSGKIGRSAVADLIAERLTAGRRPRSRQPEPEPEQPEPDVRRREAPQQQTAGQP